MHGHYDHSRFCLPDSSQDGEFHSVLPLGMVEWALLRSISYSDDTKLEKCFSLRTLVTREQEQTSCCPTTKVINIPLTRLLQLLNRNMLHLKVGSPLLSEV